MSLGIEDAAKHSASLESTAEAVMHAKTLLVELDRRQNQTREGIRALRSQQEAQHRRRQDFEDANKVTLETQAEVRARISTLVGMPGVTPFAPIGSAAPQSSLTAHQIPHTFVSPQPMWLLCSGGTFIRTNQTRAYDKLLKTQHETHQQVEDTRQELKVMVADLARLEGVDSALARANEGFGLAGR
eukprot:GILI01032851.1.p1 GENE.GILI01032851.1~~GILI01032851.1.p1  ORF type:complete len:186 (-),score=34.89 GILI01032851.1:149-706(-)